MPVVVTDFYGWSAQLVGSVRWGSRVPAPFPGVYLVALDAAPHTCTATLAEAPINDQRVAELLRVRPDKFRPTGSRPTVAALGKRLAGRRLPDETCFSSLAGHELGNVVGGQYYTTPLGARRPHAGGWFLKQLLNLDEAESITRPQLTPRSERDSSRHSSKAHHGGGRQRASRRSRPRRRRISSLKRRPEGARHHRRPRAVLTPRRRCVRHSQNSPNRSRLTAPRSSCAVTRV